MKIASLVCRLAPLALLATSPEFAWQSAQVLDARPQIFVDDHLIEKAEGVRRQAHRAEKYFPNPVITYTRPWEGHCVTASGSVLYDEQEGLFKCWYQTYNQTAPTREQTRLCYATSRDGIYWDKPNLNLIEYQGYKENNIILHPTEWILDSPVIIKDPRDPDPACRYKMMLFLNAGEARGLYGATSADGVRWNVTKAPLLKVGDRSAFFYNPFRRCYTFFSRPGFLSGPAVPAPITGVRRWVGLWESPDFRSFGSMQPVLWPDEADGAGTEFYSMQPFVYGPVALGYLEMFYQGEQDPRFRRLNVQLTVSHDGFDWERALDRKVFLQYGPVGSWDGGWVCPTSNPPIRFRDKLYIFYHGRRSFHWGTRPRVFDQDGETYVINDAGFGHVGSIGLAFLRVDGFASMDAGETPGELLTKPLRLAGLELVLNASAKGSIRVAVMDAAGRPIPGYGATDCRPFSGDSIEHAVVWAGHPDLRDLSGKTVRLQFHLKNASLYSFRLR